MVWCMNRTHLVVQWIRTPNGHKLFHSSSVLEKKRTKQRDAKTPWKREKSIKMDQIPHGLIVNTNDSHSIRRHLKQPIDEKRLDRETERNSKKSMTTCKTNLHSRSTQTGTHSKNPSRWKQTASFADVYEEILSYTCRYLTIQHKMLKREQENFKISALALSALPELNSAKSKVRVGSV